MFVRIKVMMMMIMVTVVGVMMTILVGNIY